MGIEGGEHDAWYHDEIDGEFDERWQKAMRLRSSIDVVKHLAGQHDQSEHGRKKVVQTKKTVGKVGTGLPLKSYGGQVLGKLIYAGRGIYSDTGDEDDGDPATASKVHVYEITGVTDPDKALAALDQGISGYTDEWSTKFIYFPNSKKLFGTVDAVHTDISQRAKATKSVDADEQEVHFSFEGGAFKVFKDRIVHNMMTPQMRLHPEKFRTEVRRLEEQADSNIDKMRDGLMDLGFPPYAPLEIVDDAYPEVRELVLMKSVTKHLAGKHGQAEHGRKKSGPGLVKVGDPNSSIIVYDVKDASEVAKDPTSYTKLLYNLKTGRVLYSPNAFGHLDILSALGEPSGSEDNYVRVDVRHSEIMQNIRTAEDLKKPKKYKTTLDINLGYAGVEDTRDPEERTRAFDNVYAALSKLHRLGIGNHVVYTISDYATGKEVSGIVSKHLPGQHDQSTHDPTVGSNQVVTGRGSTLEIVKPQTVGERMDLEDEITKDAGWDTTRMVFAKQLLEDMKNPSAKGFLVRAKGELVGGVTFLDNPSDATDEIFVLTLVTKRTGFAPAIMQQVAGIAKAAGKTVRLESINQISDKFYEALGMTQDGQTVSGRNYYKWSKEDAAKFADDPRT